MSGYTRIEVDEDTVLEAARLGLLRKAPDEPDTYELTEAGRKWFLSWIDEQEARVKGDV